MLLSSNEKVPMPDPKPPFFKTIFSTRMLVSLLMGFSCGLPFALTKDVLKAWLKLQNVDLALIGFAALLGIPYTLKFLWAPILDRFTPPFLGRRRGWLFIMQALLMVAIAALGQTGPAQGSLFFVSLAAFLVAFFSASQDIVVDAFRREDLSNQELGLGSSLYIFGYRVGMLLGGGGGLILAGHLPFSKVYLIMSLCMLPGMCTTFLCREPRVPAQKPRTLHDAVFLPLIEYFSRPSAWWILAFILLYKLGENMASAMTMPYYIEMGFTTQQIGVVVKLFGFWAIIGGSLCGGMLMIRLGIFRSLWIFGILQGVCTAGFSILAWTGPNIGALATVITLENFSIGMGTSAFVAFMASITDKRFTATQYALLSSLMGVPQVFAAAPTGFLAECLGWPGFFIGCGLLSIPGLLVLFKFASWREETA